MAQQSSASDLHMYVDDFYFSALFDATHDDEIDPTAPVSDSKYAEELQFQEALMASAATTTTNSQMSHGVLSFAPSSSSSTPTTIQATTQVVQLHFQEALMASAAATTNSQTTLNVMSFAPSSSSTPATIQVGQSSPSHESQSSSKILCEICVEIKGTDQMFHNDSCVHSFCSDCVTKHVATKLQESIHTVTCPGLDCKAVLKMEACRPLLPKEVLERWDQALCEALVLGAQKIYCPFKDCSIVMVIDNEGGEVVRQSECPVCHRLFCAGCQVPWHPGVECGEFQRLNEDERGREDLMVKELAKEKKWKRCPMCKFYVEKTQGCLHITCRCNFQFCYGCGEEWTRNHGGCQRN